MVLVVLPELPRSFDSVAEWSALLLEDSPQLHGSRVLIDLRALADEPPTIGYVEQMAEVLAPLLRTLVDARCAILVSAEPLLWRARLFESLTSRSSARFRAFTEREVAVAWLSERDPLPPMPPMPAA